MREITMSIEEQRRAMVLTGVVAGSVSVAEAARLFGLSERSIWRLKQRFLADGRPSPRHRRPARRSSWRDRSRIERVWGTLQDRLVTEFRWPAANREAANAVLRRCLPRFNRHFAVPPTDAVAAWRERPPRLPARSGLPQAPAGCRGRSRGLGFHSRGVLDLDEP